MGRVTRFLFSLALLAGTCNAQGAGIPRRVANTPAELPQLVLQENALFFSMLTSIAVTLSVSDPLFGFNVDHINLNLLTRHVRDAQGKQLVICRLGGVVRSNNNVEMNVLDSEGAQVGRMFYGSRSGDLLFYDAFGNVIVMGFIDGAGHFYLSDIRLDSDFRAIGSGRFIWCPECPGFDYRWYDGRNELLSSGLIFFFPEGSYTAGINRIRTRWIGLDGWFGDRRITELEAEYDLRDEATGAVNSNLFDLRKSVASFFQHPYDLLPQPPGLAWLPRITNSTWISIANNAAQEARITLTARNFDGSLLRGAGIQNPVTCLFRPNQQYAAEPAAFFRDPPSGATPVRLLPSDALPVWVEVTSEQQAISVVHFERNAEESESLAASHTASRQLLLEGLRSTTATQTELSILNPSYSPAYISLQAIDHAGSTLASAERFYVPARGFRNFVLGTFPELFAGVDVARIATLRVVSPPQGPGLAAILLRREKGMLEMASDRDESEGSETLWVPFFVVGSANDERWNTWLTLTAGTPQVGSLELEGFSFDGRPLFQQSRSIPGQGSVTIDVKDLLSTPIAAAVRGCIRITCTSRILGSVSYRFDSSRAQAAACVPLAASPSSSSTYQEITSGLFNEDRRYSGLAVLNPNEVSTVVNVQAVNEEGKVIADGRLDLGSFTGRVVLLEDLFGSEFALLGGRLRLFSASPVYSLALSGNSRGTTLSAIPVTFAR